MSICLFLTFRSRGPRSPDADEMTRLDGLLRATPKLLKALVHMSSRADDPYLDDGPPDVVPGNMGDIPEAVPRDEPFHKFANRPYTVFGRTYVPVVNRERGGSYEAGTSWYA